MAPQKSFRMKNLPQNHFAPIADSLAGRIPSMTRIGKRLLPSLAVLVAWAVVRALRNRSAASLENEAFVTGYSLAAVCALLMLLGVRKRFSTFPFGRLAIWQQTHHYLGLLSVGAYALHANFITDGWLESILAISFWAIALSGLIGWYVNHTTPRLLRAAGRQILRQDIPVRMMEVADQAHAIAMSSAGNAETATLADHYRADLSHFFASRRNLWYRICPTGGRRRRLIASLENISRYLNTEGRIQLGEMSLLVQTKDDLDFQSAIQNRIRLWATAHTWFLGGFIVLAAAHVLVVYQFADNW